MRLAVLSDLHLERAAWTPPAVDADVVVLAGDVVHGAGGVAWAAQAFAGKPVLYVAGNHENWEQPSIDATAAALQTAAAATENVRVLENTEFVFHPAGRTLRVLGCTLWVDYCLHGRDLQAERMAFLAENAKDCRNIRRGDGAFVTPADILARHRESRAWLESRLAVEFAGTTIVVTHHAPSLRSLNPTRWERPAIVGAASNLEALIERTQPVLWVHGHTHDDADYMIGKTRIVSRQRGTPGAAEFLPLVVEI